MAAPNSFHVDLEYAKANLKIDFDLKEKQLETIKSVYGDNDIIAILPTGFDKSVIFQVLPWMFQKKLVQSLCKRGIPACFIDVSSHGGTYFEDNFDDDEVPIATSVKLEEIREGNFCLVYAHPETLVDNKEVGKLLRSPVFWRSVHVCCTVIDEVHMISEWGEDFRKAFNKLGELTCTYPEIPHLALTATATPCAVQSLTKVLQFENVTKITENPDRPNIFLEVKERLPNVRKYEKYNEILLPLCEELEDKMLHFPVTRVYCDSLESVGYSFQYVDSQMQARQYIPMEDQVPENRIFAQYHKGYTDKMKSLIISELQKENPKLRFVALGMGFNSPSICRIVHFRPPTTLEKYVQEIGRAGRSGQDAHAVVYYNNSDVASNRKGLKEENILT